MLWSLTLLLAAGSFHLVEAPLRRANWTQRPGSTIALALSAAMVAVMALWLLQSPLKGVLYSGRLPELQAVGVASLAEPYAPPASATQWAGDACILAGDHEVGKQIDKAQCRLGRPGASARVLVLGDSFAPALMAAFDELVTAEPIDLTLVAGWGVAPVSELSGFTLRRAASEYYWDRIAPVLLDGLEPGDQVVLINDLSAYAVAGPDGPTSATIGRLRSGLLQLSSVLHRRQLRLTVVHGLPLARETGCEPAAAIEQWFRRAAACRFLTREETLVRQRPLREMLQALANAGAIEVLDLFEHFCPGQLCTYEANGIVLYRDRFGHPSIEAARTLAAEFRSRLTAPVTEAKRF
ncbi:MAG: SGNH/GDSL hydrolase family protein [Xanthomonadales bacterium]|nr:SGNH/GDSL hydrolase family protein [Xanthomonadales bacterium]